MKGQSIGRHPDVDYIIQLVHKGVGTRTITKIINEKYVDRPRYQINWMTLNDFITNCLNLDKTARVKLRAEAQDKGIEIRTPQTDKDLALRSKIQMKSSYIEMQHELAQRDMDVHEELEKLYDMAFKEMDDLNMRVKNMKYDRDFVAGKAAVLNSLEQARKILADIKTEQHQTQNGNGPGGSNVVIQFGHVSAYVDAIKQAVVETFRELGHWEEIPVFLSKLTSKLERLQTVEISSPASGDKITVTKSIAGEHNAQA